MFSTSYYIIRGHECVRHPFRGSRFTFILRSIRIRSLRSKWIQASDFTYAFFILLTNHVVVTSNVPKMLPVIWSFRHTQLVLFWHSQRQGPTELLLINLNTASIYPATNTPLPIKSVSQSISWQETWAMQR